MIVINPVLELASDRVRTIRTQVNKAVTGIRQHLETSRLQNSQHELVRMQHDRAFGSRIRTNHQVLQNRSLDGLVTDRTDLTAARENGTEVTGQP